MKQRLIISISFVFLLIPFFTLTVYANSSWHWLTETTPFDILPYVVVLTLLIEYIAIKNLNSLKQPVKLAIIICLANLASFLLPYTILLMPSAVGYTFEMSIKHLPQYIVGFGYLFVTLVAEVPIVYISIKSIVTNKRKFLISIIIVNVVTTIIVATLERVFCKGSW